MLGEKDAAGRRDSLMGGERSAQVRGEDTAKESEFHKGCLRHRGWIADALGSLYTLNRVLEGFVCR
jgi:hypothetical protein